MKPVRHLRALQAFDVAATTSNLSKAAETLGVTHGAVSRQIKLLEQHLGQALFHRRQNGVEKTSAGNTSSFNNQHSLFLNQKSALPNGKTLSNMLFEVAGLAFVLQNCFADNRYTLHQLSFGHHQWWRKANDVAVCWLGK